MNNGCPYKDLLASIIERAILDVRQSNRVVRTDARKWIFSNSIEQFSFLWCLENLDIIHASRYIRKCVSTFIRTKDYVTGKKYNGSNILKHYKVNV